MRVRVRLYAGLRQKVSEALLASAPAARISNSPLEVSLPEGSTIADLTAHLGLPEGSARIVFVNGISRGMEHRLAPDDEVGVFPAIGGG